LVTLTQDLGKILSSLHTLKIGGHIEFSSAMQVAQLVLKHRQNKNQHQRIITFVGSPIAESSDDLVKLGKRLKKNNIAVDIINFGEEAQNVEKLEAFINAVNTNEESHLVTIPAGPHILSDIILSSPVVVGEGGGGFGAAAAASAAAAAAAASGATGGEYDFGVDPTLDPELAMALRISMEEERARQEATKKTEDKPAGESAAAPTASSGGDVEMANADDDDMLQQALAMSMSSNAAPTSSTSAPAAAPSHALSEDEQLQLALSMSVGSNPTSAPAAAPPSGTAPAANAANLEDADYITSVLTSLPGVDPNDERIRNAIQSMQDNKKKDGEEKK